MLAGCNANEESGEPKNEETAKDFIDGQTVEVDPLSDADKEKLASVTPLQLTQEEKETYYKQYIKIVEEVNKEHNADLEVVPLNEFAEEDWIEPEVFRLRAIDRSYWRFTSESFGGDLVE